MSTVYERNSRELFAAAKAAQAREEELVRLSCRPSLEATEDMIYGVQEYSYGELNGPYGWYRDPSAAILAAEQACTERCARPFAWLGTVCQVPGERDYHQVVSAKLE